VAISSSTVFPSAPQRQFNVNSQKLASTTPNVGDLGWTQLNAATFQAQVSGPATAFTVYIYRSDVSPADPTYNTNYTLVTTITGSSANATAPVSLVEAGTGWWTYYVQAITGTNLNVSLSGVTY